MSLVVAVNDGRKVDVYEISFHHNSNQKISCCTVRKNNQFFNAVTVDSGKKQFSKDACRKAALTEALKRVPTGESPERMRYHRFYIWNAYRTMTKNPRWHEPKISKNMGLILDTFEPVKGLDKTNVSSNGRLKEIYNPITGAVRNASKTVSKVFNR